LGSEVSVSAGVSAGVSVPRRAGVVCLDAEMNVRVNELRQRENEMEWWDCEMRL
jgi:hypothetical protein